MESVKKIDNINIYLISLLPFALAAGPAVIETITVIIILLFFFSKNKIKFYKSDKFIFALYLCLILTSVFSSFVIDSLTSSIFLIRFILLYLIIRFYFFSEYKFKIINLVFFILCIIFIILIIDGYTQYFLKLSIFGTELTTSERMTIHFREDEFIMGSYISKMMPIFLSFWYLKFKNFNFKINFCLTILTILTFYCMVLSNDRAATFLIIALLIGLTLLYKFKVYYKFLVLLTILFSILTTLAIFPTVKNRYIDTTFSEILGKNDHRVLEDINILRGKDKKVKNFNFKINDKNIYFFSTAHEAHIKTAFNMFIHNPFFGIGPNNFRKLCSEKNYGIYEERGCSTHPHHFLSQILAETGIIGLFFYLITLIYIIVKLIKQLFSPNLNFNLLIIYSFYFLILMPLLPSGNIFNNWYIYSIALPFLFLKFIK
tara:strand:+ start:450 stop:1739 length:1290 start_codon:yes stop_codon:yes gene_type:complete